MTRLICQKEAFFFINQEIVLRKPNHIDEKYYENYLFARKHGVKFIAYRCNISSKEIKIEKISNILF